MAFDQFMMWLPAPAGDEAGVLTVGVGGLLQKALHKP